MRKFSGLCIVVFCCVALMACGDMGYDETYTTDSLLDKEPNNENTHDSNMSTVKGIIYVEPYTVNASKGDIIFTGTPYGLIGNTLTAGFGGYWAHSGMMIDDGYHIRHNTLDIDKFRLNTNWLGIPTSINPYDLEHGLPGLQTQKTQWCGATDVVLKPKDEDELTYRPLLEEIADTHIWLKSYYRVHSYINPSVEDWLSQFNDSNTLIDHKGAHCSGQLWYANYLMGKEMNVFHAGPDAVDAGAHALFQGLYESIIKQVKEEGGFWGNVINAIGFINYDKIASKLANQVTNAFGLDVYDDTSDTWRNHLGKTETHSVAPDHLMMSSMVNPAGNLTGIQTETSSYYGKIENTVKGGGYYIDTNTGLPLEEAIVTLYTDADFNGSSQEYWQTKELTSLPWNDALSSIKVALGYKVTIYHDINFGGGSWSYYCDNSLVPWNDTASSMRIEECEPPVACVFKDKNYREIPVCYFGEVSYSKLSDDIGNDHLSSVQIFDPNYKVVLYEHENYGGASLTCLKDTSSLGSFDNQASSLKVMLTESITKSNKKIDTNKTINVTEIKMTPMIDYVDVEKNPVCLGEDFMVTVEAANPDGESYKLNYSIGGKKGNPVILNYQTVGDKQIHIFVSDGNTLLDHYVADVNVIECMNQPKALLHSTFSSEKQNEVDFEITEIKGLKGSCTFDWDFGDGKSAQTTFGIVSHNYGDREQKSFSSTFVAQVTITDEYGTSVRARKEVTFANIQLISSSIGEAVIPITYDRIARVSGDTYTVNMKMKNIFNKSLNFSDAIIKYMSCDKNNTPYELTSYNAYQFVNKTSLNAGEYAEDTLVIDKNIFSHDVCTIYMKLAGALSDGQKVTSSLYVTVPLSMKSIQVAIDNDRARVISDSLVIKKVKKARAILGKKIVTPKDIEKLEKKRKL